LKGGGATTPRGSLTAQNEDEEGEEKVYVCVCVLMKHVRY